jgi:predicted NUDIX family NTP pyrophosphohydrolase
MPAESVGILMHKRVDGQRLVLLVHPGGPFWRGKDLGAWSIPKGEPEPGEDFEVTARREFAEELGVEPEGPLLPLGRIRQRGGKAVTAFAIGGDLDVSRIRSSEFDLEWPPKSGRIQSFPEVDRAEWFDLATARKKILEGQRPLLDRLEEILDASA